MLVGSALGSIRARNASASSAATAHHSNFFPLPEEDENNFSAGPSIATQPPSSPGFEILSSSPRPLSPFPLIAQKGKKRRIPTPDSGKMSKAVKAPSASSSSELNLPDSSHPEVPGRVKARISSDPISQSNVSDNLLPSRHSRPISTPSNSLLGLNPSTIALRPDSAALTDVSMGYSDRGSDAIDSLSSGVSHIGLENRDSRLLDFQEVQRGSRIDSIKEMRSEESDRDSQYMGDNPKGAVSQNDIIPPEELTPNEKAMYSFVKRKRRSLLRKEELKNQVVGGKLGWEDYGEESDIEIALRMSLGFDVSGGMRGVRVAGGSAGGGGSGMTAEDKGSLRLQDISVDDQGDEGGRSIKKTPAEIHTEVMAIIKGESLIICRETLLIIRLST